MLYILLANLSALELADIWMWEILKLFLLIISQYSMFKAKFIIAHLKALSFSEFWDWGPSPSIGFVQQSIPWQPSAEVLANLIVIKQHWYVSIVICGERHAKQFDSNWFKETPIPVWHGMKLASVELVILVWLVRFHYLILLFFSGFLPLWSVQCIAVNWFALSRWQ